MNSVGSVVADDRTDSVASRASTAAKWSAASRLLIQILQFVTMTWMAHLLSPAVFGYASIVLVISNFAVLLGDLGIGSFLVREREISQRAADTAMLLNLAVGVVLTAGVIVSAPLIAELFGAAIVQGLLVFASFTYAANLTVVPMAILERELRLRPLALSELVAALIASAGGILGATLGMGAYAVVLVPFLNVVALTVLLWAATRYWPKTLGSLRDLKRIVRYGWGVTGFNFVNYFSRNADNALLGRFSPASDLGFYSRAYLIMLIPVQQIQSVIGRVLLPALARVGPGPELVAAHRRALSAGSAICAPIATLAAACSPDFVLAFFGRNWEPMTPMIAILSTTSVFQVFIGTVGTLYQITGRTGLMFKWNILFTAFTLACFAVGVQWGAIGMCVAVAARTLLLMPITMQVPLRLIGDSIWPIYKLLAPIVLSLVAEAGASLAAWQLLRPALPSPLIRLAAEVACGAAAYLVCLRLVKTALLVDTLTLLTGRRVRPTPRHRSC